MTTIDAKVPNGPKYSNLRILNFLGAHSVDHEILFPQPETDQ